MKKIAKLSLVAAVAVAGLTSTASAASLEEAIKGVDVSGQFRFRANDKNFTAGADKDTNDNGTDVEIEVGVKVPVTDNVTAVFKIDNANDDTDGVTKGEVTIEDYYFSYANGPLTVNFGQQNIPGRLTDGAQGDGVVALYNLGAVTLGAASFITHNVGAADTAATVINNNGTVEAKSATTGIRSRDVRSVIAMGNVGPVSLLGQYADIANYADAYNLKADAKLGVATVGVEYSEVELDSGATKDDRETLKVYASGSASIVSAKLTYAKTGDNGSGTIDAAAETPAEYLLWNVGTAGKADLDLWAIDASVKVTDKISLRAAYADGEYGTTDTDLTETLGQVSYKAAKNLNTYFRIAQVEDGTTEYDRGRIEVRYSF